MTRTSMSLSARRRTGAKVGSSIALAITLIWGTTTIAMASPILTDRGVTPHSTPRALGTALPHTPVAIQLPTLAAPAAPTWSIAIDTVGHQDELDQCLWVRMDFTDTAPIIGKHNYCGGDMVLDMVWGQTVQLAGLGLDGTYLVTGDRQAFSGEWPSEATAGMTATLFLQTCYWDTDQGMRLVALTLLPDVPRVVAGAS